MKYEKYKDSWGFWGKNNIGDRQWYLLRCFKCNPKDGVENYSINVANGSCYACGYKPEEDEER